MQQIFHDFGTSCLRALGINNQANQCYISAVHLPSCYQGIINNDLLLIIDSGASICITPHHSNFITYQQSKMKIKDLSSLNNVAGEGLLHWKIEDVSGRIITFDLHGYHIPNAKVCLLSPQVLLSTYGSHTKQTTCKVEVCLADGVILIAHLCPRSCLPLLLFVPTIQDRPCFWTETFSYSISDVSEIKTILG